MSVVNDELVTPGCPQCAIKHLSAALAYMVGPYPSGQPVPMSCVWAAVARINLVEVMAGYKSHLWYAVGMLERSEEAARCEGSACATVREARLMLEENGLDGVEVALRMLHTGMVLNARTLAGAHCYEAAREFPFLLVYPITPTPKFLLGEIERIRKEFFDFEEVPAASTEDAERGGESIMAKAAKKAAPAFLAKGKEAKEAKGAKAACKGGKAAKAACKGGKCKK
jgi:hypothetical protein